MNAKNHSLSDDGEPSADFDDDPARY